MGGTGALTWPQSPGAMPLAPAASAIDLPKCEAMEHKCYGFHASGPEKAGGIAYRRARTQVEDLGLVGVLKEG